MFSFPAGLTSDKENELLYDLFEGPGYNPLIRPVENISEIIQVSFGVTLFQVILVEERTQVMKTNNWIRMVSVCITFGHPRKTFQDRHTLVSYMVA